MLYNIRLQYSKVQILIRLIYQVVIYHLVDAAREVDFLGKNSQTRQNREFCQRLWARSIFRFQQKLMDGPAHLHCGFMELWKTVKHAWNPEEMDNHSEEERNISTEDILKTLDRFGSKTPSPVEDVGRLIAMEPSPETGKFFMSAYTSLRPEQIACE